MSFIISMIIACLIVFPFYLAYGNPQPKNNDYNDLDLSEIEGLEDLDDLKSVESVEELQELLDLVDDEYDYYDYDEEDDDPIDVAAVVATPMMSGELLQKGQECYVGRQSVRLVDRQGYYSLRIKGLQHYYARISQIGRFEGYAKAEINNKHDAYAIAIYREDNIQMGHLPAGNSLLHGYILQQGGCVHCEGYIATYKTGRLFGEVAVESNKELVEERNQSSVNDKYYNYEDGWLKSFLDGCQK